MEARFTKMAFLLGLLTAVTACISDGPVAPPVVPGVSRDLAQHRSAILSNIHYRLYFKVSEIAEDDIKASLELSFDLNSVTDSLQLDFTGTRESITQISCNGSNTSFEVLNEHIVVPKSVLRIGHNTIEVTFLAGQTSLNRNPEYLYTLFVPERARTAFPLFDQPDLKARYDLTLVLPSQWTALSNGPVVSVLRDKETVKYQFATTGSISSYLFSFVAGEFETITRTLGGTTMTLFHRESDATKISRNLDDIFDLHLRSIEWMEQYTGIKYPFQKFDFALIPSFQYGGMEHIGAVQYRASSLLLDESPSQALLLKRANLIAHETAHMWFGNLVTMQWFDDVWTKEVFANFMAAKIVNPGFPEINHELNFFLRHYSAAYAVDRSSGTNPIRQDLPNLNEAGNLYGSIIYHKAPIMMRQLELLLGENAFRQGMQEYLKTYAFGNATWPQLIKILDSKTETDLATWSEVWVNSAGRPHFELNESQPNSRSISQVDPLSKNRIWPQQFSLSAMEKDVRESIDLNSSTKETPIDDVFIRNTKQLVFNSNGLGYGLFPADLDNFTASAKLNDLERGSALVSYFENFLQGNSDGVLEYYTVLRGLLERESNPLLNRLILSQLLRIHHSFLSDPQRDAEQLESENILWRKMLDQQEASGVKTFFNAFAAIATTSCGLTRVYNAWAGKSIPKLLKLAENDYVALAELLAIRLPEQSNAIVQQQLSQIENPDNLRRFEFIAPTLSADVTVRDAFFDSLADERQRNTERWVVDALLNLHHYSRVKQSLKYIRQSLELLEELQRTGDIFFPTAWLGATLQNHYSAKAIETVDTFLAARPNYNAQLRMKILQAVDLPRRATQLRKQ